MLNVTEFLIAVLLIGTGLLLAMMEIAVGLVNKIGVRRHMDGPRHSQAENLLALLEERTQVLMALSVALQFVMISTGIFLFVAFVRRDVPYVAGMPGTIALMMVVVLLFRQLLPRIIVTRDPETALFRIYPLFRLVYALLRPVAKVLAAILNFFHSWEETAPDEEQASEEEIQAFISAGQEEGILEHQEGELIQSIVEFGDKIAREVMTPRTQIVAVELHTPLDRLAATFVTHRVTRVPVYLNDLDNIEGVIHERDLLRFWKRTDTSEGLRPLIKSVHFIPETKAINDLLQEMKTSGEHMVVVIDEYGGVAGLVTMEDLVEEIVGEIYDEADDRRVIEESAGVFIAAGTVEREVLEEKLGMTLLENSESTTVAGAALEIFGRLPQTGERTEHLGLEIEILEADRRRVHRIRVRVLNARQASR